MEERFWRETSGGRPLPVAHRSKSSPLSVDHSALVVGFPLTFSDIFFFHQVQVRNFAKAQIVIPESLLASVSFVPPLDTTAMFFWQF